MAAGGRRPLHFATLPGIALQSNYPNRSRGTSEFAYPQSRRSLISK